VDGRIPEGGIRKADGRNPEDECLGLLGKNGVNQEMVSRLDLLGPPKIKLFITHGGLNGASLDRAIFWIEYVIRHKGTPHLQTHSPVSVSV
jgi:hypothetical protein